VGGAVVTGPQIHSDDEVIAALESCGSINKAAKQLGVARSGLQARAKRLALKGYSPAHDMTHAVPDGYKVKGVSTLYREDGTVAQQWVKSSADAERQLAMMREAIDAMTCDLPKLPARKAKGTYLPDLMTVYPIGDLHVGMRSWLEETGANWDLKIAERVQCGAMAELVSGAPATETAAVIDLGDWLHSDGLVAQTPRSGHPLDADGRYAKIIQVGMKIIRQCIESALERHKFVRVICIPGNHNESGALWMSAALSQIYENEPRVTVDTQPSLFAYFQFGKTLVGVHHGHTVKMEALPGVMAADRAEMWGTAKYRYWYTGHIHNQQIKEFAGCTVESFNTLAPNDAYAANGGWRSRQNMKAIILHKEFGEVARHTVCPQMLQDAAA
jgi:hypothetical protein